ncbi:putative adenylate kinase [Helianthus anomalus]
MQDLRAMTNAAGSRPVILINPRLKDLPASSGIMQVSSKSLCMIGGVNDMGQARAFHCSSSACHVFMKLDLKLGSIRVYLFELELGS